jgi:hypothetical protein
LPLPDEVVRPPALPWVFCSVAGSIQLLPFQA